MQDKNLNKLLTNILQLVIIKKVSKTIKELNLQYKHKQH